MEPMETLEANTLNEVIPAPGEGSDQAAGSGEGGAAPQSQADAEPSKATLTTKTSSKPLGDSKTPNKNAKTKPGTTPTKTTTTTSKTPTRLSNGVSKPHTNGVTKKATSAPDRKATTVTTAAKKPTGTTPTPKSTLKTAEKKTPTATPLPNGAKTTTTTAKRTASATATGVKTSSTIAAAKKPAGPKPVTSTATKTSSTASPTPNKTPVSKPTRTPYATSVTLTPNSSMTKSSAAGLKSATSKPSTMPSKPATSKPTTPSAGKAPGSHTSKSTTPVKKDVAKPASSSTKKPIQSPLARATPAAKSAKQDSPKPTTKTDTASKKVPPSKAADSKTPNRSKPESKATPSKDASKTPKTAAPKTSQKKTVGSSTPTPVKRGPKTNESDKEVAVAVATAAAIAAAANVIAKAEEKPSLEEAMNQEEPTVESHTQPEPIIGPVSPVREVSHASILDFQTEEGNQDPEGATLLASAAPFGASFNAMTKPQTFSPVDAFGSENLMSPNEKEEAVEKAEEEINEDDEYEEEEDEEQRRYGYQPSSMITDMSSSQPSEEQVRTSAFGGSQGWHGDDLLSGMDSEDVSSCTSSRQQGVSDLSSTLHTAILEGTQSSDALVDSSLRGSEGDANLTGSPNVETLANEEEDEDEEDERVDDMDLSSEKVDENPKMFSNQEHEEEDEDVEMHSEGKTESGENVEEDLNENERLDNLNQCGFPAHSPPTSSWGQTNPFSDPWAQPASGRSGSSPSPMSDHDAADSETPTQSPAQTCFDASGPTFTTQSESDHHHVSAPKDTNFSAPTADAPVRLGDSETSTPEDLCEYDSSSGVESRSDKPHTPVPAQVQPDLEQDLGIHMEKVDGEEEEAETLPADEVLGTGPPTAPASAPSSASTSGDEASDTEGEMQINDPDEPITMGESAGFDSQTPTSNLPAFNEDEEVVQAASVEAEEDGGGATPQSANSVASYGFDCTNSNSNAHSMAESCGKSPGIFSLENEEQLPEEAKDPSLIKELTLPSAGAAVEDLLGRPVDLMPLGHSGDLPDLHEHHYMIGGKMGADLLHEAEPREPGHLLDNQDSGDSDDNQPPYYSTICDKTDSFLEGNQISDEEDEDSPESQSDQSENLTEGLPIANGHYLALVPGNRRPINPALAALIESCPDTRDVTEQHQRLEKHQEKVQQCQEEKLKTLEEEEAHRRQQQKQLQEQRRELLQLQHRHRLQWQLELELQYRMQQKYLQQQQQLRRSPTGLMLSPSSGLCTIYEAMETSDEEEEDHMNRKKDVILNGHNQSEYGSPKCACAEAMQELEWNMKVDMVQQLFNHTIAVSEDGSSLLLLPVGPGGCLSPLESVTWPHLQFSPPTAVVTSVSSYSPDGHGSSSPGDWTVVELETQH
uniref:BTB/POZ domain-containing protein n=1 Tax=Knipowitschia caucasica TaxID=637954 RepID=A0AAV2KFI8_KNICA